MDGTGDSDLAAQARARWQARLDAHAEIHGFHVRLAERHGALFTEESETLLVTFEQAEAIREGDTGLPFGLSVTGREGWSQLTLYAEGLTWFRDDEVIGFFDDLVDDGFFDHFDRVVFYGAAACGYAAAAYSVAAPGATVVLVRPEATQDPRIAEWDRRHTQARKLDFTGRYGFAPEMLDASEGCLILYDPAQREDAMHAALFARPHVTRIRCRHLGRRTEEHLLNMGMLVPLLLAAGRGKLTEAHVARLYRKRRLHPPYLRHVQSHLEAEGRARLAGLWCRAALRQHERPAFRRGLEEAQAALAAEGRALPPALPSD